MAEIKIEIEKIGDDRFEVELYEGDVDSGNEAAPRPTIVSRSDSKSVYLVTLGPEFVERVGLEPGEIIKRSFEFLLKREPKESILFSFTIPDTINNYFPEFQDEIMGN